MTLKSIWGREAAKRSKFLLERHRCDRNWPIHKDRIRSVFKNFLEHAEDFYIHDQEQVQRQGQVETLELGTDIVALHEHDCYSGRHSVNRDGEHDYAKEYGGALVIHYTYTKALIQVFLIPPKSSDAAAQKKDILIWSGRNTDALTIDFLEKSIAKLMVFIRVESGLHVCSFIERMRVRYWRFVDGRNTGQVYDGQHKFLNRWELSLAIGVLAVVSLVVSILKP